MDDQFLLFETPPPPPPRIPRFSLVLAIFPDPYAAQQITDLGNSIRKKHGMYGRMRPISHLHVSMPCPGPAPDDTPETLLETIGRVCRAATAVMRPFEIKFDRVMSFRGRPGNRAVVLLNDKHGNDWDMSLCGLLRTESSKKTSATSSTLKFTPHLTLLYDKQELALQATEPVSWTVKEIVLVFSEGGATKYHHLGRWQLGE